MKPLSRIVTFLLPLAVLFPAVFVHAATAPVVIYRYANSHDSSGWIGGGPRIGTDIHSSYQWIPGTNGFLRYKAVDFGSTTFTRFEIVAQGKGIFEVRLGKPDNPAVATISVGTAGYVRKLDTMTVISATTTPITGIHDVYIVGKEQSDLVYAYSFSFYGTTTITQPRTFYVSPSGSDADSGTLARPFRTINRAANIMVAGDICYLRRGIYPETLRPRNSGVPGSPIRFEAYNNEPVVISAADRLTGWQKWQGNIYRTPMPWTLGPGYNQLYADSQQVYEARFPSINTPISVMTERGCTDYNPEFGTSMWCWWTFPHPQLPRSLSLPVCYGFTKGTDVPLCDGGMGKEACGHSWVFFHSDNTDFFDGMKDDALKGATFWKEGYFTTESGIVTNSRLTTMSTGAGMRLDLRIGFWYGSDHRGYVSGALPLLNTENEWVYSDGYAYVWMPGGVDPSNVHMSAKRRITTIDLSDRSNIEIRGIRSLGGLLTMANSRNCIVDRCDFKYITHFIYFYNGGTPLDSTETFWKKMDDGIFVSGNDNRITNTSIAYAASGSIVVAGLRNIVEDCKIHDFGYTRSRNTDIYGEQCAILRSSIFNGGRACISIGSNKTWANNKLMYCDIYNSGLFAADGGTYYTYGPCGNGSEIAYNWFRQNLHSEPTAYMYFDGGGGTDIKIHHNVFFPRRRRHFAFSSTTFALPTNPCKLYHNTIANYSTDNMADAYPRWETCQITDFNKICAANNLDIYDGGLSKWGFVDTVSDFRLTATSPAINAGRVLDPAQFPGAPAYTGKPDLGAYQYGGKDWRPGHTWGSRAWPSLTTIASEVNSNIGTFFRNVSPRTMVSVSLRGIELRSDTKQLMTLRLFDSQGRCVASARDLTTRLVIPTRDRSPGFYVLRAEIGTERLVKRVMLK